MSPLLRNPALLLADRWQRDFPLTERPFAEVAAAHDLTEAEAVEGFASLMRNGTLSRIGAVVRPHAAGASTLAALSCPAEDIERIAGIVSAEPFVNHNYERDHAINLWFVVAAPDEDALAATLSRVSRNTGCAVLDLRLERPYHIDLGFGLANGERRPSAMRAVERRATAREKTLLAALEDGLPLEPRPYGAVADRLGWPEQDVIAALRRLIDDGIIARFGCVIRHREVGYTANAMAVWDVPGEWVDAAGHRLAGEAGVTLCYRRNRVRPAWTYNLFAMVHGTDAAAVRRRIGKITQAAGLPDCKSDILFSRRCFTQRGARFSQAPGVAA